MEALTCRPGPGDSSQGAAPQPACASRPVGSPRRTSTRSPVVGRKTRASSIATESGQRSPRTRLPLPLLSDRCKWLWRGEQRYQGRLQRHREAVEGCLQGLQASHSVDSPHPREGLMRWCPSPWGLCTSCFSSSCRIITPWGFLMNRRDDLAPGVMILLVSMAGILIPLDKGED